MFSDKPIDNQSQDKLCRYSFAVEIANGLVKSFKNTNDSIVIGINGGWGTGKSSLINFLINEILDVSNKEQQEVIILKFNPWVFSGQIELQNIFFKELYLKLQKNKEKFMGASEKLSELLDYLNWLKYFHKGAGEAVKDAKDFLIKITDKKDLVGMKQELDSLLIESKVRIYVTIDDIDRLTPQEITDIFQLVKLNANFANTTFILAYDQDIVINALQLKFGDNGGKYIEKIVQIDYTIPQISEASKNKIFIDSLLFLFDNDDEKEALNENKKEIEDSGITGYFSSIRDIYRFVNSVKIRFSSIFRELNIKDFFIIEALRIFNHDAYKYVINNKRTLVNESGGVLSEDKRDEDISVKNIIDSLDFDLTTKSLLKELFLFDKMYFFNQSSKDEDLIREKRIANKIYFERYFILQLNNTDISESVFDEFINSDLAIEKLKILRNVKNSNNLFSFFNFVDIKSNRLVKRKLVNMIYVSFDFLSKTDYQRNAFYYYNSLSDFEIIIRFCSKLLLKIESIIDRQKIVLKYLKNNPKSFVSLYVLDSMIHLSLRIQKQKPIYNYNLQSVFEINYENDYNRNLGFINELKDLCKEIVKNIYGELLNENNFSEDEIIMILNLMNEYNREEFKESFELLISTDKDLIRYVWLRMKYHIMIVDSTADKRQIGYSFSKESIHDGLNKEKIISKIKTINRNLLDSAEKKVLDIFLKAEKDGFDKNTYYDSETLKSMSRD